MFRLSAKIEKENAGNGNFLCTSLSAAAEENCVKSRCQSCTKGQRDLMGITKGACLRGLRQNKKELIYPLTIAINLLNERA